MRRDLSPVLAVAPSRGSRGAHGRRPRALLRRGVLLGLVAAAGAGVLRPPADGRVAHRALERDRAGRARACGCRSSSAAPSPSSSPASPPASCPTTRARRSTARSSPPPRRCSTSRAPSRCPTRRSRPPTRPRCGSSRAHAAGAGPGRASRGAGARVEVLRGAPRAGALPPRRLGSRAPGGAPHPVAVARRASWRSRSSRPTLWWDARHGFASIGFQLEPRVPLRRDARLLPASSSARRSPRRAGDAPRRRRGARAGADSAWKRVAAATLLPLLVPLYSAMRGSPEVNWTAHAFPPLAAAAGAWLAGRRAARPLVGGSVALAGLVGRGLPRAPVERQVRGHERLRAGSTGGRSSRGASSRRPRRSRRETEPRCDPRDPYVLPATYRLAPVAFYSGWRRLGGDVGRAIAARRLGRAAERRRARAAARRAVGVGPASGSGGAWRPSAPSASSGSSRRPARCSARSGWGSVGERREPLAAELPGARGGAVRRRLVPRASAAGARSIPRTSTGSRATSASTRSGGSSSGALRGGSRSGASPSSRGQSARPSATPTRTRSSRSC